MSGLSLLYAAVRLRHHTRLGLRRAARAFFKLSDILRPYPMTDAETFGTISANPIAQILENKTSVVQGLSDVQILGINLGLIAFRT